MAAALPGLPVFGYTVDSKTYTAAEVAAVGANTVGDNNPASPKYQYGSREIPVKFVPQNTLLFHYAGVPVAANRAAATQDEIFDFLAYFISNYAIECRYNPRGLVGNLPAHFTFCFSNNTSKQNYSFPNPAAGFGIKGYGVRFNIGFTNILQRDSRFAYLKSGSAIPNAKAVHRRIPLEKYRNYDYQRIKLCDDQAQPGSVSCKPGSSGDVCLTPQYVRERQIDGCIALAGEDALLDITAGNAINTVGKSMFQAQSDWVNRIHANRVGGVVHPADKFLLELNMLCLESDLRPAIDRYPPHGASYPAVITVGYSEYVTLPYGHETVSIAPPNPLPPEFGSKGPIPAALFAAPQPGDYQISDTVDANGNSKRFVTIFNFGLLINFINTYVLPRLLLKPMYLHSQSLNLNVYQLNQAGIQQQMAQVPNAVGDDFRQRQYLLNKSIGNQLLADATASRLNYDYLRNIFVMDLVDDTQYEVDFIYNYDSYLNQIPRYAANPIANRQTMRIRDMMNMLIPNVARNMELVQRLKISHEVISTAKYAQLWAHWIYSSAIDALVLVGPFYQAFCTDLTNHAQMITNYMRVITTLDPHGITDSHGIATSQPFVTSLDTWARNPPAHRITINGVEYPYVVGKFFDTLMSQNPSPLAPYLSQSGGVRRPIQTVQMEEPSYSPEFIKNLQNGLRKRNSTNRTQKNSGRNKNSTIKPIKNRNNNRTIRSTKNRNTSRINKNSDQKVGHTSNNIEPFTMENAQFLAAVVEHPIAGPIFKSFFVEPPSSVEGSTNKSSNRRNASIRKQRRTRK